MKTLTTLPPLPTSRTDVLGQQRFIDAICFPHTEFEIERCKVRGNYHVSREGEWQACYDDALNAIRDLLDRRAGSVSITNGENGEWDEPTGRLYPNWPKWSQVKDDLDEEEVVKARRAIHRMT